jgi:primosomal protein N' (replication factor Y)
MSSGTATIAEVALPLPIDRTFHYTIPAALRARIGPGSRVAVPFQTRLLSGYVVRLLRSTDVQDVKDIADVPDMHPTFDEHMLELTRWVSEYYFCSWGEALACAAPPGAIVEGQRHFRLKGMPTFGTEMSKREQKLVALLNERGEQSLAQLQRATGVRALQNALNRLESKGVIESRHVVPRAKVKPKKVLFVSALVSPDDADETIRNLKSSAPAQAKLLETLIRHPGPQPAAEILQKAGTSMQALRALEGKGLVLVAKKEVLRTPAVSTLDAEQDKEVTLTGEQQKALDTVNLATTIEQFGVFLLKGITSSGKTEVYLRAIERVLEKRKTAIVLVPEISLTPQTVARFIGRFGDSIAVLHSRLSAGERYDEWRRIKRGDASIVVGARSAVFAPVRNLGMVVVDEEHDHSYKQADAPRYHARDVAIMRAKMCSAVVVLGSATPSLESYHNCQTGKFMLLELGERVTGQPLPTVTVIDMRQQALEMHARPVISLSLQDKIDEKLSKGEQVMVFLNRRGYAPFLMCQRCGHVPMCTKCYVSLTYHKTTDVLQCHYCNSYQAVPPTCPECHEGKISYMGAGTQRTEQNLRSFFPEARIERMDLDTTSRKGAHHRILSRFRKGEIDILVGTQMIAKGHDFPGVTLVGVVSADVAINMPDFRAAERVFQLLTQVAGRAGRGTEPGEVVIQTYNCEHYSIQAARTHDYDAFRRQELALRREANYPPFTRLAHLVFEGEKEDEVLRVAGVIGRKLQRDLSRKKLPTVEILGPAPAPLSKLRNRHRWHVALLSPNVKHIRTLVTSAKETYAAEKTRVAFKIDMDAIDML